MAVGNDLEPGYHSPDQKENTVDRLQRQTILRTCETGRQVLR